MSNTILLNLGRGNLKEGFSFISATLKLGEKTIECSGSLPPAPEILEVYRRWQLLYQLLYQAQSIQIRKNISLRHNLLGDETNEEDNFVIDESDITQVSEADFLTASQTLQTSINSWLDRDEFRPIERQIHKQLQPEEEFYLIIKAEDSQIKKIPWYVWHLFTEYPHGEVAFAPLDIESLAVARKPRKKVRVLAILGDSTNINLDRDREILQSIAGIEISFLVEPDRQELDRLLWHQDGWDILFFAGHSYSSHNDTVGKIFLNQRESLTIAQLKNALGKAIRQGGLRLAIFNSCEGFGLASQLSDLNIPQTIVMSNPVPDQVAQEFLTSFLSIYAQQKSFPLAFREARERLQGIESSFPGASWLPVIFQNPTHDPPTWEEMRWGKKPTNKMVNSQLVDSVTLKEIISSSTVTTLVIFLLRFFGILQGWELPAFDFLVNTLPKESADSRLVIIGVDEEDLNQYGYPLPDSILADAVTKIMSYRPSAIGIDIFRPSDQPIPSGDQQGYKKLTTLFAQNTNLITICSGNSLQKSIAPPLASPDSQVGFVDLYDDRFLSHTQKDDKVRRYLLSRSDNAISKESRCYAPYSFAWQLAHRYFTQRNINVTTAGENWQFGDQVIPRLVSGKGGYQRFDDRGNQILISYRRTPQLAQQLTLRELLTVNDTFNPNWIKNRVVLLGITADTVPDTHDTLKGEIRGLHLHGHVVSQLIHTVESDRSLWWFLPWWGDLMAIVMSALVAGVLTKFYRSYLMVAVGVLMTMTVVWGICWPALLQGGWLPLVPMLISLPLTTALIYFVPIFINRKKR